jgi:hypothetical protein
MLRLYGVPVAPDDAMWFVYTLRQVGRADDLTAAETVTEKGGATSSPRSRSNPPDYRWRARDG